MLVGDFKKRIAFLRDSIGHTRPIHAHVVLEAGKKDARFVRKDETTTATVDFEKPVSKPRAYSIHVLNLLARPLMAPKKPIKINYKNGLIIDDGYVNTTAIGTEPPTINETPEKQEIKTHEVDSLMVDREKFIFLTESVTDAVAAFDTNNVLGCMEMLLGTDGVLKFHGTDGSRLHSSEIQTQTKPKAPISGLMRLKPLKAFLTAIKSNDAATKVEISFYKMDYKITSKGKYQNEPQEVELTDNIVKLRCAPYTIKAIAPDSQYPQVDKLQIETPHVRVLDKDLLYHQLRRLMAYANERTFLVTIDFSPSKHGEGVLVLKTDSHELNTVALNTFKTKGGETPGFNIHFNVNFLLAILRRMQTPTVEIHTTDNPLSQVTFSTGEDSDTRRWLVMPVMKKV